MVDINQLLAQRAAVDGQINEVRLKKRAENLAQIHALIAEAGFSRDDVFPPSGKRKRVAPKYRDELGNTWAGRGKRPNWLREALSAGRTLESFAVQS